MEDRPPFSVTLTSRTMSLRLSGKVRTIVRAGNARQFASTKATPRKLRERRCRRPLAAAASTTSMMLERL
jgi:hypothetical protein